MEGTKFCPLIPRYITDLTEGIPHEQVAITGYALKRQANSAPLAAAGLGCSWNSRGSVWVFVGMRQGQLQLPACYPKQEETFPECMAGL